MKTLSWCCDNYDNSIPCVQKLLIRVGNVEAKYEKMEERVQPLEVETIAKDSAQAMVKGELSEQKRRLNVMSFKVPESKKESITGQQNEDKDFLMKLLDTKMNSPLENDQEDS